MLLWQRSQWDDGQHHKGITSTENEVNFPLYSSMPEILCSDLVPSILKRCGQAGEGQEKGHCEACHGGEAERAGLYRLEK